MGNHLAQRLMIKLWRKLERIEKTLEEDREVDVDGMEENGNASPLVEMKTILWLLKHLPLKII